MPDLTAQEFTWDDHFWVATVRLASWQGFQSRHGDYASQDTSEPSDGTVKIVISPEGRDKAPLSEPEIELARWAIAHEREMQVSALAALLPHYAALRPEYAEFIEDPLLMPPVVEAEGFKSLIGLHSVNIHQVEKDGRPYVGLEFGCTWDDEHGLGALMHGTRVVEIGGADTAITLWIAERDASQT
ncbi:MAG: hypothetical protein R3A48_24790 [Polyangiales bacterium]